MTNGELPSMSQVRDIISDYLYGMNFSPHRITITAYDAAKKTDHWEIEGEFQDGFLGEKIKFEASFRFKDKTLTSFKVTERASSSGL